MNYFLTATLPRKISFLGSIKNGTSFFLGLDHAIFFLVTISVISLLLFLSKRVNKAQYDLIFLSTSFAVTALEILKIIICIFRHDPLNNFLPLYFCGLFNFAIWFAMSKNETLSIAGYSYITMGGISAGFCFLLYPSTALGMYPLLHPSVLHSAFFHGAMIYLGILTLLRGVYQPKRYHFKYYFIFVSSAVALAALINTLFGTNCMFLRDPFGLPLLAMIRNRSKVAYAFMAWLGQSCVLFKINILFFEVLTKIKSNINN